MGAGGGGYRCVPLFQHHERPQSNLRHRILALPVSQGSWRWPLQRGETYYYAEGMFLFKRKGGREGGGGDLRFRIVEAEEKGMPRRGDAAVSGSAW